MKTFVGVGINPDGRDLPLGLGMRLVGEPEAMDAFSALPVQQRDEIVAYIQGCNSASDAKKRIRQVVDGLKTGTLDINLNRD